MIMALISAAIGAEFWIAISFKTGVYAAASVIVGLGYLALDIWLIKKEKKL
jgi:FtsH-binding integral membrane protein